jgi:HK97 family phage major capsid protein
MADYDGVHELLAELKSLRDQIAVVDAERRGKIEAKADRNELQRVADDMAKKVGALQAAVNNLSVRVGRPGSGSLEGPANSLRESARGLLLLKHQARVPKSAPDEPVFSPSEQDLEEAELACLGIKHLFKCTTIEQLPMVERKALTAFNMGASGFILQPEMSDRILSCLVDPTDLAGLVGQITISGPSIKFMVDDVRIASAGWACDSSCFANNPPGQFMEGLGELEIKAESLRYAVCASRDILEDASVNVESWMFNKVSIAFRNTVSEAILAGDGIGKPLGLLHSSAGIQACDTGPNTPAGIFTWQDLISVQFQVPVQWHSVAVWVMNQRTFGQVLTMSDAMGRPLMIASPVNAGQYIISGLPVKIATQMPDCVPGATPVLFGNLQATYLLAVRKQTCNASRPLFNGVLHPISL